MKHALYLSVDGNMSMDSFVSIIHILTTKEIQLLLKNKDDDELINQLICFKNEIRIFGNRYEKIY